MHAEAPWDRFADPARVVGLVVGEMAERQVKTKPKRRSQAERSATTRDVLLDATIRCLHEHGYSRTTTQLVAKEAGVSRGAMLHQFPTVDDLMAYVMEAVFDQEVALYRALLAGIEDPRERLVAYPAAVWKVLSRPEGVAVLEILQGSRTSARPESKIVQARERIEAFAKSELQREFPRGVSNSLLQLIVGAARGLSITQVIGPDGEDASGAILLLQNLLRAGIDAHIFSPNASLETVAVRARKSGEDMSSK